MKKPLILTLQNLADNTVSDNTMTNFLIRNLATNLEISPGAASSRVAKLESFGYAAVEIIGQGVRIAITEAGRKALLDTSIQPSKARRTSTKPRSESSALPEGYILLKDFVKSASAARRKLRTLQEPKPCSQWAWPQSDIERIKSLIGEC